MCGPGCGGVSGHAEYAHCAGANFHDEHNIESARRDAVKGRKIGRQQPGCLTTQKGVPPSVCTASRPIPAGKWPSITAARIRQSESVGAYVHQILLRSSALRISEGAQPDACVSVRSFRGTRAD